MENAIYPPWWRPDAWAKKKENLEKRARMMKRLRAWFETQDFVEVDTPALQISPGNEVHLHAFKTVLRDPHGAPAETYYLHTSPEFSMKKLLVAGLPRIYQCAHAFRNEERSSRHHPEFIMLEWYRAGAKLEDLQKDCIDLTRTLCKEVGCTSFSANGMTCDPFAPWEILSIPEAFQRYCAIDILATTPDPIAPSRELLAKEALRIGVRFTEDESWDDIFFRIMGEKIEPVLGKDKPTFLCDYPVSMAALARPNPHDPRLANRFELYMAGVEIANAFDELTDADEQERRFQADMDLKEKLYGERYPVDTDFIAALRHGMPEASGIALGLDRLIMLCCGAEKLEDILWCPVA